MTVAKPPDDHNRQSQLEPEGDEVSLLFAQVTEALARSTAALLEEDVGARATRRRGRRQHRPDRAPRSHRRFGTSPRSGNHRTGPGLRRAVGLLLILPELERSADLAEHIAQRALTGIGAQMTPSSRGIVQRMSEVALSMWARAAAGYAEGTVDCDEIDDADDELDVLHEQLTNEVAAGAMAPAVAAQVTLPMSRSLRAPR